MSLPSHHPTAPSSRDSTFPEPVLARSRAPISELKRHLVALVGGTALLGTLLATLFVGKNVDAISSQVFFDTYGLIYLTLTWALFRRADVQDIRDRAARERGKRRAWFLKHFPVVLSLIVVWYSIQAVLVASPWAGSAAERAEQGGYPLWILAALSALTVIMAWTLVQVAFAHSYGVLWYSEGTDTQRSIGFPGDDDPTARQPLLRLSRRHAKQLVLRLSHES